MTPPAISILDLHVRAGQRTILSVDALDIAAGEITTILGPNGAGKSTLLRTCLGFQRPTTGRVRLLGKRVETLGSWELSRLRRRVGYMPQILAGRSQMPLTVREVVAIGRTGLAGLLRPLRSGDWRIVDEWIDRLGLSRLAGQRYADVSGGEQRKALLARAMAQQPDVLLLDEPTANLDLAWREEIVVRLDGLHEQTHTTIVLVCHELEVIPRACRRVVLLVDGRLAEAGTPEEVLSAPRVRSLYGPRLRVLHEGGRHAVVPTGEGPP